MHANSILSTSGPVPINEFSTERLFARAYPWLFPGGIGDVKDFPGTPKQWGKNLFTTNRNVSRIRSFCFGDTKRAPNLSQNGHF